MKCAYLVPIGLLAMAGPLAAQQRSPLPVLINVSVARDSHEDLGLLFGNPESFDAPEYALRVAIRLPKRLYGGIGLGRWRRSTYADPRGSGFCDCLEYVSFVSQTTVPQGFLQWYPAGRRVAPFLRVGAGLAYAEWFRQGVSNIEHAWRTDTFFSLGGGADVRLFESTYVTLSVDHSRVAVPESKEGFIRRTTSLGLGLTIR